SGCVGEGCGAAECGSSLRADALKPDIAPAERSAQVGRSRAGPGDTVQSTVQGTDPECADSAPSSPQVAVERSGQCWCKCGSVPGVPTSCQSVHRGRRTWSFELSLDTHREPSIH